MFVLDASIALAWMLPGQMTATAQRALRQARKGPVVVPALWLLETQNALLTMVRQKKLSEMEALELRTELGLLSKRVEGAPSAEGSDAIWAIASRHMMTIYDAAYVELAWRLDLPVASDDQAVRSAARSMRLELI